MRRTTISCRCFARIALPLGLSLLFAVGRASPVQGQNLPDTVQWSVPSAAPPSGAPIVAGDVLVVPLRAVPPAPEGIIAHSLRDGAVRWSVKVAAEKPLAADAERVYVADGEAIHAFSAADGSVAWRTVAGRPITAPPLAHAGWVIVAAAGDLIAIRAADGVVLWRKPLGPIEFRPALDGDLLVASLVDGRLVALNLKDGSERWTANLKASPGEPFAIGGTVYVGTRDKIFYAIIADSGRIEDHPRIGGPLRGRVAVDDQRVYMAGLDNMLRVVRRDGGALLWQKSVVYRPASGPVLIGNRVVVPGLETGLPAFAVDSGAAAGTLAFDGSLVALPVFTTLPDKQLAAIGITGGLDNKWIISLRTPSLVPRFETQPLTALPGEVVPIPQPPR